jgi:hypothetical protein
LSVGDAATGRTIENVVLSGEELHSKFPLCFSIISLHTNKPRPVPSFFVVKNGSNIDFLSSAGISGPLLEILILMDSHHDSVHQWH